MDDPDATVVLHELQDTISSDEYKDIRQDIFALRAPPDGMPKERALKAGSKLLPSRSTSRRSHARM